MLGTCYVAGEGDDDGAGWRPDRAPGGRLPAQQQAHAAAQRPHRAALPPVLEEQDERDAVSMIDARRDSEMMIMQCCVVFGKKFYSYIA